jgi:HEAT repeat protein
VTCPPKTMSTEVISALLRRPRTLASAVCALAILGGEDFVRAQEPAAPQPVSQEQLRGAIDQLGNLDYNLRTSASQTVRRAAAGQAVPALLAAISSHTDGYVRYRALVLLTGFNDSRIKAAIRESMASPNDRLRTVAYGYLERNPDPALVPMLLEALQKEVAEFVRPALIRALAALGSDPRIRPVLVRESGRGEDFFRSAVIEAFGDYKADYAVDPLLAIANLDGPLTDDAALALGKIGDRRAFDLLVRLRMHGSPSVQPFVAAAVCLLGADCEKNEEFLAQTLTFSESNAGFQELVRGAATGLGALAVEGRATALDALLRIGLPAREPTRSRIALAVATIALRNTPLALSAFERHPARPSALELLAEGFDMLEEDLEKERFFAFVRRAYWEAPEASPARGLAQALIGKLDF